MPTRHWRGAEPPWPQRAENTNGYYIRTAIHVWPKANRQWQKRGRYVWPIPKQAAENTNGYYIRAAYRIQPKTNRQWQRRGHYIWPVPLQAAENTNGYYVRWAYHIWAKTNRQWQRRGHLFVPIWDQIIPPPPNGQRRVKPPYAKRGSIKWPIPPQAAINTNGYYLFHSNQHWLRSNRYYGWRQRSVEIPWTTPTVITNPNLVY